MKRNSASFVETPLRLMRTGNSWKGILRAFRRPGYRGIFRAAPGPLHKKGN